MTLRGLVALSILLVGALAVALPSSAEANPDLKEARKLLEELFVEKAAKKFKAALERGDSDPTTTAQIHLGLGETEATLGDSNKAFEHYKRALAIDTLLDLPPGTSPKVAQPLQNARKLFRKGTKKLALAVNLDTADGVRASATVLSDPFEMVAGIAVELIDEAGDSNTRNITTDSDQIPVPLSPDSVSIVVSLIDEHGNKLVTNDRIELPEGRRIGDPVAGDGDGDGDGDGGSGSGSGSGSGGGGGSLITNWVLWAGVAGAFGATGAGFGLWSRAAVSDLEDMIERSGEVEYSDALELEEKAKTRALIANISFGLAGAAVVAATVFYLTDGDGESKESTTALVPVIGPDQVGVSATLRF